MIVVANPSGRSGQSFKGLHAYCAHDPDRAESTERVEWISTRNLSSDPDRAWKEMAATAMMADQLKASAGVKAGRKTKNGPVLHLVLSFDQDEDLSRGAMEAAADKMLASLGADPTKMRGKSKPSRRQFADEHQSILYAHADTKNTHLHIMLNTVHPEHGVRLPTSNNHRKLQRWALKHTKDVGTEHKYPVRSENAEMRDRGEYVKGPKRVTRNMWELQQAVRGPVNDNNRADKILAEQRAKDAALLKLSRTIADRQLAQRTKLDSEFKADKNQMATQLKTDNNRDAARIREEFRPRYRALSAKQAQERKVFEALEKTMFGRASNMAKAIKASQEEIRDGAKSGAVSRAFKILTRATERKAAFDRKQLREQQALKTEQNAKLDSAKRARHAAHSETMQIIRNGYLVRSEALKKWHDAEAMRIKAGWAKRAEERKAVIEAKVDAEPARKDLLSQMDKSVRGTSRLSDEYKREILGGKSLKEEFIWSDKKPAHEQDNEKDNGRDK